MIPAAVVVVLLVVGELLLSLIDNNNSSNDDEKIQLGTITPMPKFGGICLTDIMIVCTNWLIGSPQGGL